MRSSRKEKILNFMCRRLVEKSSDDAVNEILDYFVEELNISAAILFKTTGNPLLFELAFVGETEPDLQGRNILLDYSEHPDWNEFNPYGPVPKSCVTNSTESRELNVITKEYVDEMNIKAFVACPIASGGDVLGIMVFTDKRGPREWTFEELDIMTEISSRFYSALLKNYGEETQKAIVMESERVISESQSVKSQFISNVSHEIRTPINSVIGMLSIMRHNLERPAVMEQCLDRIEKASHQVMEMIGNCVDMTLLNNGDVAINYDWMSLGELLDEVNTIVGKVAKGREQQLFTEYEGCDRVYTDKDKLTRILVSTMVNACRYSPDGGMVCMAVRREDIKDKKAMFFFNVLDSGPGISDETKRDFFDPYSNNRSEGKGSGAGFDMMMTKHLVDVLGGTIEVHSESGNGTELVIGIPMRVTSTEGASNEEREITAEAREFAETYIGRRILVAEDNTLMAEILATILSYRGLETDTAVNGKEALNLFLEHDPFYYDMIFMDIQMPVMDGIEAAKQIRDSGRSDSKIIPIAALSANAFEEDIRKSLEAGMNVHLNKPVGEDELFATISEYVF